MTRAQKPASPVRLTPPALATQVWAGNQDWNIMALYQIFGERLKVEIHRDTAYAHQSWAKVSIYSASERKFNVLATLPASHMRCGRLDTLPYADESYVREVFAVDVAELLRLAMLIIPQGGTSGQGNQAAGGTGASENPSG